MDPELNKINLSPDVKSPNEEKFLFFFQANNVDKECIGGISLVTGIKIFSVVSLLQAINSFMDIFQSTTHYQKIVNISLTLIFLVICFCAFFCTVNENMSFARISYCLAAIIFLLGTLKFLWKGLWKMVEFINPWDGDFLQFEFFTYILGRGFILFAYLYFIWIIYCFMSNHSKNN